MNFYDATTKQGICQRIDFNCDTTDATYSRLDKTREVNVALETLVGYIIGSDGYWNFDDSNFTTNPVGTATLTEGQSKYAFSTSFLDIESVDILDANGMWVRLQPFDQIDLGGRSPEEYFGQNAGKTDLATGMPVGYDKFANGIQLGPAPTSTAVTLTAGLRIRFKRTASLFTATSATTDDTTQPGIASPFHYLLADMASIPYCQKYKKDRVAALMASVGNKLQGGIKALLDFYSTRAKDERVIIKPKRINHL